MSPTSEPPEPPGPLACTAQGYDVLVPVKPPARGKTRLHGHPRAVLARAFALDAITAALAARRVRAVHLLSDDPGLAADVAALGVATLPDHGEGDLNAALRAGARLLAERSGPVRVAAMLGDLPCLRAADLDAALAEADAAGGGFVPDADGTGTTLLVADTEADTGQRPVQRFAPRFGPGSRAAHAAAGVPEIGLGAVSLRRDVDTAADLDAARALGLGAHSAAALLSPR